MRPIKFRAWDKEEKRIRDWEYFLLNPDIFMKVLSLVKFTNSEYTTSNQAYNKSFELEIMQFTGLHDKNGKEIWEGDVIEVENEYWTIEGSNPWRGEVEFKDGMFYAGCQVPSDLKKSEVLGNIYEHPHLLTGKQ